PNPNFDPFVSAVMRQIGIGMNIPYEVLSKHFQSSYSAARAALLDAWRTFRVRREWLAVKLCQPVYEEWLADAVATGLVAAPGFFADPMIRKAWSGAKWNGDGPGSIDPEKEARAARERMDIGLTTLAEEIVAYDGGDWETKHRQQVEEKEARIEGGLIAPVTMPLPGAAAPIMTQYDNDTNESSDSED
ncbi:MAG: phage portal protein, partial [Oxalobacteraceae bacterium]|nr:phage portal protein [Oxalobacteraceae bacterium]